MLLNKQYYDCYSQVSPLVKKYLGLCFLHSLHQLILQLKRTTECTKTLIDYILANSSEKVIQSGVIWNAIISSWVNLLFKKNVVFENEWTLRNINKVNEKLLRWFFCGKIRINKISWQLQSYLREQCLSELCH